MSSPARTRQACDRCHLQKLRCPKQPGSPTCARCLKAGTRCAFSPHGTTTAAAAATAAVAASVSMSGHNLPTNDKPGSVASLPDVLDSTFFWPPMLSPEMSSLNGVAAELDRMAGILHDTANDTLSQALPEAGDALLQCPSDRVLVVPVPSEAECRRAQCVQQLCSLMTDMDNVFSLCPPEAALHFVLDDSFRQYREQFVQKYSHRLFLERLFAAIHSLLGMYPRVIDMSLKSTDAHECLDPDCIHLLPPPPEMRKLVPFLRQSGLKVDCSAVNLLIACHSRLLDVLDGLLQHSLVCTKVNLSTPEKFAAHFELPELRLGSFVPPREVSSTMQLFILMNTLSTLSARVKQLLRTISAIRAMAAAGDSGKPLQVLALQGEMLQERHDSKLEQLKAIGDVFSTLNAS